MPRIRRGLPPTPEPLPDPQGDEWGHDPEEGDEPELPDLPPLPPQRAMERPTPPPRSMVELGPPPDDPMAAAKWAHRLLTLQAYETMLDPNLSETQRRKEIRTVLRDASKHLTDANRYDIKLMILKQRSELEDRKRYKAAAKLEKRRPGAVDAKIIPIRRDG